MQSEISCALKRDADALDMSRMRAPKISPKIQPFIPYSTVFIRKRRKYNAWRVAMQSITALAYINELAAYEFPTERWNLSEISFEIHLKFRGKQILVS